MKILKRIKFEDIENKDILHEMRFGEYDCQNAEGIKTGKEPLGYVYYKDKNNVEHKIENAYRIKYKYPHSRGSTTKPLKELVLLVDKEDILYAYCKDCYRHLKGETICEVTSFEEDSQLSLFEED